MIHVIVADDQALIRGALSALIDLEDDMRVVAQAADGREAIAAVEAYTAENSRGDQASKAASTLVVIMDVEMPVMDGISAAAALKERGANARVLMVTTFGRPGYVQRALDAGAVGFIVKDAPAEQLLEAIRRTSQGLRTVDPALAVDALTKGQSPLSAREVEVLRAFESGGTVEDVASELMLSAGTVRNYVSSAMDKTHARTRAEALKVATENGWL
ncbi:MULTISPECIES: response regulator transcription factor [Actinomycetaceae]|jgi:DNA-binding response regulator|uniref:response regulator transcription factor n=1 Tax=Actinomycetaceae TaxID=2049 RepID=UPI0006615CCE|nr:MULTISPECIES: response regulator transcription factor [Actinomycetaceae]MBF1730350.1 response regulator transcription factor [Trueperella pyogenes]MDU2258695.1 response regulator transcription factor [Actinomyces sp.]MDU6928543.1 response regulator transcription factor [Dermabacter sp.]